MRNNKHIYIILSIFILLVIFSGCSGGGGSGGKKTQDLTPLSPTTQFTKIDDLKEYSPVVSALQDYNITNTDELASALKQAQSFELLKELKDTNATISAEGLRSLAYKLERDIVLKPLKENHTISTKAYNSIVLQDLSVSQLKSGPLKEFQALSNSDVLSASAQEKYDRAQWMAYNNNLAAFFQDKLTFEEFKNLKDALKTKKAIFGNISKAMQNVEVNATTQTTLTASTDIHEDNSSVIVVNKVDEHFDKKTVQPVNYLQFAPHLFKGCASIEDSFPFQVMGKEYIGDLIDGTPMYHDINISQPHLGNENSKRYFQINETGVAELVLFNGTSSDVTMNIEHNSNQIFSVTLASRETRKVYIPIATEDVCVPYYLTKNDDITATVTKVIKAGKMDDIYDAKRNGYDLVYRFNAANADADFLNIGFTTFNMIAQEYAPQFTLHAKHLSPYNNRVIQYIIKSPTGKIYEYKEAGTGSTELTSEDGTWQIYAFPMPALLDNNLQADVNDTAFITLYNMKAHAPYKDDSYEISLVSPKHAHLKKFVIAQLDQAEFSHDGESDPAAEVQLSLNTNMAPRLDIGNDLKDAFNADADYSAYLCWQKNGQSYELFKENQICNSHTDGLKKLYLKYLSVPEHRPLINNLNEDTALYWMNTHAKSHRDDAFSWYATDLQQRLNDSRFHLLYDTYNDIYNEWKNNVVQINKIQFPLAYHYGMSDLGVDERITATAKNPAAKFYALHPVVNTEIPVFAFPKDKMAQSTLPLSFEYSAKDLDEVDEWAQFASVAKLVVNQALAIATQNYSALVCNTVDTLKELRQIEINGEDDPIGEADFMLNRYSTNNSFYGLTQDGDQHFSISGFAEIPNYYTSYDQTLDYAGLACNITGAVTAGASLYNSVGSLISGDFYGGLGLDGLRESALSGLDSSSQEYANISQAFDQLASGAATAETFALLENADKFAEYTSGIDVFLKNQDVTDTLGGLGGEGHNSMRSEANYFFTSFEDRKTRGKITLKDVDAMPVVSCKVKLTDVQILDNFEEKGDSAEVKLRTRVGVISDKEPQYQGEFATHAPFMFNNELQYDNGAAGYTTLPNLPFKGYLLRSANYNGIDDGDKLPLGQGVKLYDALYPSDNNLAAIYVEIGLYEGDGGGVDDDMIGVLAKTFYLEDLYKNFEGFYQWRWHSNGAGTYTMHITNYPVYDKDSLESSVELLDAKAREQQMYHNKMRTDTPSALISFDLEIKLGDFVDYGVVDTNVSFVTGDPVHGKKAFDFSSVNVNEVSSLSTSSGSDMHLLDVYKNQIAIHDFKDGLRIIKIDNGYLLKERTDINATNLADKYKDLFKVNTALDFYHYQKVNAVAFVDTNNILVLNRESKQYPNSGQLVLLNIGNNNGATTIWADENLSGQYPSKMQCVRVDEHTIRAFVSFADVEHMHGKIVMYEVTSDTITKKGEITTFNLPQDILAIDNKTLLVKSADLFHRTLDYQNGYVKDTYWYKKQYLTLYELQDDNVTFNTTAHKQLDFANTSYARGTEDIFTPIHYGYTNIYNVNHSKLNRIVRVAFGSTKRNAKEYINYMNLLNVNGTYLFGERRASRLGHALRNRYFENSKYAYYLEGTTLYPSDLSRDNAHKSSADVLLNEENSRIETSTMQEQFLDALHAIAVARIHTPTRNGQYLMLFRVSDYKPATVQSDILNKKIYVESSQDLHINFKVIPGDTPIDDLNINLDITTITAPQDYNGTHISDFSCVKENNESYQCQVTIHLDQLPSDDTILEQEIVITVEDDTFTFPYTTQDTFTIYHKPLKVLAFIDAEHGMEPWKTDATTAGTQMIQDINHGKSDSIGTNSMHQFKFSDGYYFFASVDSEHNRSLMYLDSHNNISAVDNTKKFIPYSTASYNSVVMDDKLYFLVRDNDTGNFSLWVGDAAANDVHMIKDLSSLGTQIGYLVAQNHQLYFGKYAYNAGEIYISDGTASGTVKFLDLNSTLSTILTANGKLFFYDDDGLYSSDGTQQGTKLLTEAGGDNDVSYSLGLVHKQQLYFLKKRDGDASEDYDRMQDLYKTDGESVTLVKKLGKNNNPRFQGRVWNDRVYFYTDDGYLYQTDGTEAGTVKVAKMRTSDTDFVQLKFNSLDSLNIIGTHLYMIFRFYNSNDKTYYKVYTVDLSDTNLDPTIATDTKYKSIIFYPAEGGFHDKLVFIATDAENYLLMKYTPTNAEEIILSNPKP